MNEPYSEALQSGLAAMERQDVGVAETQLRAAVALRPESHQAHYLLGATLAQVGRSVDAENSFLACLGVAPEFGIARFQLGLLQIVGSRLDHGCATLRPLTFLGEDDYLKWFAKGLIELVGNDRNAAVESLERGLALNQQIPALNHDIRGILSRLQAATGLTAESVRSPEAAEDSASASHFLIAGYRQT
jgi:tetratricopeptide (TPR) repeat protein